MAFFFCVLILQKPHKKFAHNLKLQFQKTASKIINLTKRYDHLRTRRIIFHVFNVNLVFNSDVINLSPTLTAYNFFPVHFQTKVPKKHLISIKFPFEWYIKLIFLKEPKIRSWVPVLSASGHIWWRHKNPEIRTLPVIFRLEAKCFRNPREISYKKTYISPSALNLCVGFFFGYTCQLTKKKKSGSVQFFRLLTRCK